MELHWDDLTAKWFATAILSGLFLGLFIPLVIRIRRGIITSHPVDGPFEDICRENDPKAFWKWNAWLIGGMIVVAALLLLIWSASPGDGGI